MNRSKYKSEVEKLNAQEPGPDLPNQKFPRGCKVRVGDDLGEFMSHFPSGFDAIVEFSYAQKFRGNNVDSYSLIVLEDGVPVNSIAWYYENQLTLIDSDTEAGKAIIDKWEDNQRIKELFDIGDERGFNKAMAKRFPSKEGTVSLDNILGNLKDVGVIQ